MNKSITEKDIAKAIEVKNYLQVQTTPKSAAVIAANCYTTQLAVRRAMTYLSSRGHIIVKIHGCCSLQPHRGDNSRLYKLITD